MVLTAVAGGQEDEKPGATAQGAAEEAAQVYVSHRLHTCVRRPPVICSTRAVSCARSMSRAAHQAGPLLLLPLPLSTVVQAHTPSLEMPACFQRRNQSGVRVWLMPATLVYPSLVCALACLPSPKCPTNPPAPTRLGVNDNVILQDELVLQQGVEGQLHAGGVAARVGHQACGLDLVTVQLCEAIHSFFLQLRCCMLTTIPVHCERVCNKGCVCGWGGGVQHGVSAA